MKPCNSGSAVLVLVLGLLGCGDPGQIVDAGSADSTSADGSSDTRPGPDGSLDGSGPQDAGLADDAAVLDGGAALLEPSFCAPPRAATHDIETYMMFDAYKTDLSEQYIENTLNEMARKDVAGIMYGTVGFREQLAREGSTRWAVTDEVAHNDRIYDRASAKGTEIWLQMEIYNNRVLVDGAYENLTAVDILDDRAKRRAFAAALNPVLRGYADRFPDDCTIIFFEEAGIYHSRDSGGAFWNGGWPAGRGTEALPQTEARDRAFETRFTQVYDYLDDLVRAIHPSCRVGPHLGHMPFNLVDGEPIIERVASRWSARSAPLVPEFIFYDLYVKAVGGRTRLTTELRSRLGVLSGAFPDVPVFYLAQLHTTNNFGSGFRRTPSALDIETSLEVALGAGAGGVGFYTKNTVPTLDCSVDVCGPEDLDPLFPNLLSQRTVYESSRDRWEYGMQRLMMVNGLARSGYFDLVVTGRGLGLATFDVFLWNYQCEEWVRVAILDPQRERGGFDYSTVRDASTVRLLRRHRYMGPEGVRVRIQRHPDAEHVGSIERIYAVETPALANYVSDDVFDEQHRAGTVVALDSLSLEADVATFVEGDFCLGCE